MLTPIIFAILGLCLLMIVHEGGHYLAARAFKMRVTKFSIGFGPPLFRHTPKDSPTTWQVAALPLLAYVQIAGMNPLEEVDPNDKGSYANAGVTGRITTIFAGPLANYLFASVLIFASLLMRGQQVATTTVDVVPGSPAAAAEMKSGDTIVQIAGSAVTDWDHLRALVVAHPNEPIEVVVQRDDKLVPLQMTPAVTHGEARIGVATRVKLVPIATARAAVLSIEKPAEIVAGTVIGIGRMIAGKEKPELSGPIGIVRETAKAMKDGFAIYLFFIGAISAYLGAFNLLPIPALDGGRLMFLAYEAATRRRPDPRIEAQVHAVGLVMMLALIVFVTFVVDIPGRGH
jgi:regulator of sigma E protease